MISPFNQYAFAVKQLFFNLLGADRYKLHEGFVGKLSDGCASETDYTAIGNLLIAIYESGYFKALDQQKELLAERGLNVSISIPVKEEDKIFKN